MTAVADLVDRAAALPPGPQLSATLGELAWEKVPNTRLVDVLQARSRQLAHDQAELFAGMVEISHAVAIADLPSNPADDQTDDQDEAVARAGQQFEWAAHEIAAGLTWTPTATDREFGFATALVERLPLVYAALQQGRIDRGKARVFVEYLDPATGELSEQQSQRLCARFVPQAPRLTTKQLADRLYRALHAIDPELRRRHYQRAVQERGVALYLDRTGTATLAGNGLPPHEAAAAAERVDRLVEAVKRAGHPGRRGQISADVYLGLLDGELHGLTEQEIIDRLLATRRPEDHPDTNSADTNSADDSTTDDSTDCTNEGGNGGVGDCVDGDTANGDNRSGDDAGDDGGVAETAAGDTAPGRAASSGQHNDQSATDRWASDRVATREGIEIRAGLGTVAGLDDRPGEIPGLGPVAADIARTAAAAQRRGAAWLFAIVDSHGYLLLAGRLRRRPHTHPDSRSASGSDRVRGGVVELHLTLDELQRYAADPGLAHWHPVLAEIAARWADRDALRRRLAAHPRARFARGPLADHVRIRDRNCCGPGCTRSARRSDLDHTRDHSRGGRTVEVNIGPACRRHHPDKHDRRWTLTQPEPGQFRWISPLGRVYRTRGEPVRPDLPDPDPDPAARAAEQTTGETDQRLRRHDPRILHRPAANPPRPPPKPDAPPDDKPPF